MDAGSIPATSTNRERKKVNQMSETNTDLTPCSAAIAKARRERLVNQPRTKRTTMSEAKLNSNDLLSCPFCGRVDMMQTDRDGDAWEGNIYFVRCIVCDVLMMGETEQDAINKWNLRANPTGQEREASLDPNCSNNETPS